MRLTSRRWQVKTFFCDHASYERHTSWSYVMVDTSNDAKRLHIRTWRMKAEQLRTIVDGMKNEHTRRLLQNAAANYERLADEAEERERSEGSRSRPKAGRADQSVVCREGARHCGAVALAASQISRT